jgi:hypothetical protein
MELKLENAKKLLSYDLDGTDPRGVLADVSCIDPPFVSALAAVRAGLACLAQVHGDLCKHESD